MISVKTNFTFESIAPAIKKSVMQSVYLVHNKAVENAPFQSWDLRRSILPKIKEFIWVVWTNKNYWRLREYSNKKNPHTRFYMKRALESSEKEIEEFFTTNILKNVTKKK